MKSIGLPLESRGQVQVSINLVDFERTPLYVVFDAVKQFCDERKIEIAGSELIGMIPAAALAASSGHDLQWENLRPELILENRLRCGWDALTSDALTTCTTFRIVVDHGLVADLGIHHHVVKRAVRPFLAVVLADERRALAIHRFEKMFGFRSDSRPAPAAAAFSRR